MQSLNRGGANVKSHIVKIFMICTYFDRIQIVYVRYLTVFQDFSRNYRIPEVMQFISKL